MDQSLFHIRLEKQRLSKNLTQEELANRIGVARSTYANYERGIREPDLKTIRKISEVLDIKINDLLDSDNRVLATDNEIEDTTPNIAFIHGGKDLTEDEQEYLKESLEMYRKKKAKWMKEKEKQND